MSAQTWLFSGLILYGIFMLVSLLKSTFNKPADLSLNKAQKGCATHHHTSFWLYLFMASGGFIILPEQIFRYGFTGLIWPVLFVTGLLYQSFFNVFISSGKPARIKSIHSIKSALLLLAGIWMMAWQLKTAVQFMIAFSSPNIEPYYISLTVASFMLVYVHYSKQPIHKVFTKLKLFTLFILLLGSSFIIYAYIGGFSVFLEHVLPLNASIDTTNLTKIPALERSFLTVLALISLLLLFKQNTPYTVNKTACNSYVNQHKSTHLRSISVYLIFLGFIVFSVLLGYGAHFTGGNPDFVSGNGQSIPTLFKPLDLSTQSINLLQFMAQELAAIIPLLTAVWHFISIILLLSSTQFILVKLTSILLDTYPLLTKDAQETKRIKLRLQSLFMIISVIVTTL